MSILRNELFEVWYQQIGEKEKNKAVLSYVINKLNLCDCEDSSTMAKISKDVSNFTSKVTDKWKNCNRIIKDFRNKNQNWLDTYIIFLENPINNRPSSRKGRPTMLFTEVSNQSKRKKVSPLVENYTKEELTFATCSSLRLSGHRDAALMVETVTKSLEATKIKHAISRPTPLPIKYTPEEALALYITEELTVRTYLEIRSGAKERNADIYPSYDSIKKAKKACYPLKESIYIKESSGEVHLQSLVDKTVLRLAMVQKDVLIQEAASESNLTIIYKWGCDGSAGHSRYKQKFTDEDESVQSDEYLFAVCLVPLRLQTESGKILWNNPRPSSTRFCRPIKISFQKETNELSKKEIEKVENQIKSIKPTKVSVENEEKIVSHNFQLSMIDGKIFSAITESSTQTCGICGATPKCMNDIERVLERSIYENNLNFGLSTLHAWIRSFETLLHVAYKLGVCKWQIRDEIDKNIVKERKNFIIQKFKAEMGLLVDLPKQGFGTTNDGNTARRFFQNPSVVSGITGIDENLIKRFAVILQTMSCGFSINSEAFREYAITTAKMFVELYPWYYMPSSIHKILIHGADIINNAVLPIGMLSEEALESRNKDFKRFRQYNTRKMSRTKTMEDLFNILLLSSDPLISSIYKNKPNISKKRDTINKEVLQLLSDPEVNFGQNSDILDQVEGSSSDISTSD